MKPHAVLPGKPVSSLLNLTALIVLAALVTSGRPGRCDVGQATAQAPAAAVRVVVNWNATVAWAPPSLYGGNDFQIDPKVHSGSILEAQVQRLGLPLLRVHNSSLSDSWSSAVTQTWDPVKVQSFYDGYGDYHPVIVQTIPGPPSWMKKNDDGTLDSSEYDRYATFCADLVTLVNKRLKRNVTYWEPMNEWDLAYSKANKLDQEWEIYNRAAIAMKVVDPKIKLVGPALAYSDPHKIEEFLKVCGTNVDVVSVHSYETGDPAVTTFKLMTDTSRYASMVRAVRGVIATVLPARHVPVFVGEYNINYDWKSGETRQQTNVGAVWMASVLKNLALGGADMAAVWNIRDGVYGLIGNDNQARPPAELFILMRSYMTGRVVDSVSTSPLLDVFAVKSGHRRSLMLMNMGESNISVDLGASGLSSSDNATVDVLNADGLSATNAQTVAPGRQLAMGPYTVALVQLN